MIVFLNIILINIVMFIFFVVKSVIIKGFKYFNRKMYRYFLKINLLIVIKRVVKVFLFCGCFFGIDYKESFKGLDKYLFFYLYIIVLFIKIIIIKGKINV